MLSLGRVWSGGGETTLGGVIQYRSAGNDPEKDGLLKQANLFRFPPQTFAFLMLPTVKVSRESAPSLRGIQAARSKDSCVPQLSLG